LGQFALGVVGIPLLPHLTNHPELPGIFGALAATSFAAIVLSFALPSTSQRLVRDDTPFHTASVPCWTWIAVGGTGLFQLACMALWAYIERIGFHARIGATEVQFSLSASAAAGFVGSVLVLALGNRAGLAWPLALSFAVFTVPMLFMVGGSATTFAVSACLFCFAWPVFAAYQFGSIARLRGSVTAYGFVAAAQYAGYALGPYLASLIEPRRGPSGVVFLQVATASAALVSTCMALAFGRGTAASEAMSEER
jgi:hypothetical protein